MPELDLLAATAYDGGQMLGRAFRWMMLLAIALVVVVAVARGTFFRSRLRVAVTVIGVVVCLVGSIHYDFAGPSRAQAGSDMSAAREEVMLGCLDQGQLKRVCECYGDEVLRRIDRSAERFAALEREMIDRQNAGQGPPELIVQAAQACAGRTG